MCFRYKATVSQNVKRCNTFTDARQKQLAKKIKDEVTFEILLANGLVRKNELVKILGRGALTAKLNVTAHKFTATAQAAIEASGGKATNL